MESTNDVNLYAGSNSGGINSSLDLEVLADAYNKTALPVYTDPSVKNTMAQSNQVMIAGGSTVGSVRHVNVKAGKGKTTVTESAREYNIYTGTGGSGSVASTALGENIKSETAEIMLISAVLLNLVSIISCKSISAALRRRLLRHMTRMVICLLLVVSATRYHDHDR